MKRTYQPFIIKLCDQVFEELSGDVKPIDENKEALCDILTEKFIQGKLSEGDEMIFDSEEEIDIFLRLCWTNENLIYLKELGYVDTFDDGESYFLTEAGKVYVESKFSHS